MKAVIEIDVDALLANALQPHLGAGTQLLDELQIVVGDVEEAAGNGKKVPSKIRCNPWVTWRIEDGKKGNDTVKILAAALKKIASGKYNGTRAIAKAALDKAGIE